MKRRQTRAEHPPKSFSRLKSRQVELVPSQTRAALAVFYAKTARTCPTFNQRRLLLQQRDQDIVIPHHWQVVTERAPTIEEIADLLFA